MCTLLAGKRKVQVQDRLMELDIVPALLQMFDRLDWNRAPSTSPPMERSVPIVFKMFHERVKVKESQGASEVDAAAGAGADGAVGILNGSTNVCIRPTCG